MRKQILTAVFALGLLCSLVSPSFATPTTWYVSTTGSNSNNGLTPQTAFATINYATTQVTEGDTIQVLPGIYNQAITAAPYTDCSYTIIGSPNDPSSTVLDGQNLSVDYAINTWGPNANTTRQVAIKGLTVRNFNIGNIIIMVQRGHIILENLDIYNNTSTSQNIIQICPVLSTTLNDVVVRDNHAKKVTFIASTAGSLELDRLTFVNNHSTPNDAGGGGLVIDSTTSVIIRNSLIADNEGGFSTCGVVDGGVAGIFLIDSNASIINSTIANNFRLNNSTGIFFGAYNLPTQLQILNSIIWGNYANPPYNSNQEIYLSLGTLSIAQSDIEGGQGGIFVIPGNTTLNYLAGNIGENPTLHNPKFIDSTNWLNNGFSLQNDSPCAGTGISTFIFPGMLVVNAPTVDINNNLRPVPTGTQPDMGAYEINQTVPPPATYTISGTVWDGDSTGTPLVGALLTAVGTGQWANTTYTAVTGIWGNYSLDVPYSWSGDITPSKNFYTFDPVKRTYTNVTAAMTGQDYHATLNPPGTMYNISGKVKTSNGVGISGVEIWAKDDNSFNPEIKVATSGIDGTYSFKKVLGWYGTARPKSTYRFTPESIHYSNLGSNKVNQDYTKL